MSLLLIPIAPLSRTKSRLRDCFSQEQLKELTIAMFKDLANTLAKTKLFTEKLIYSKDSEILELSEDYGLRGIQEPTFNKPKSFSQVIEDLNSIAVKRFNAKQTLFLFLDLILISEKNLSELYDLLNNSSILVCPAINSAGISVFGRNPPNIISSHCFSDPYLTSLASLYNEVKKNDLQLSIYDSFRAGFDVDIKQDLLLAYEYLKIFSLTHTHTYDFLRRELKISIEKVNEDNNRQFKFSEII